MAEKQDKDQQTEQATPQKLEKAAEEGKVAFSAELLAGVLLTVAAGLAVGLAHVFLSVLKDVVRNRLTEFERPVLAPRQIIAVMIEDTQSVGIAFLALVVPLIVAILVAGFLQTNFNLSTKSMAIKWDKLSVPAGFGRIFSSKSAVKGLIAISKSIVIVLIVYMVMQNHRDEIALASYGTFPQMMETLGAILLYLAMLLAVFMLIIGVGDFMFQKWKFAQEMKMSMQEIKDEQKDREGDPMIRARIKRIRNEMSRKRMLADVPKATAVVTNPTHFAVALQYDRGSMDAPVVVAKGADFLAKKIIEVAKENGVPVIERKPLARFLYANVEIGNPIPVEVYQAVAEILNFVNRLRRSA